MKAKGLETKVISAKDDPECLFPPLCKPELVRSVLQFAFARHSYTTSKGPRLRTVVGNRESLVLGAVQIGELEPTAAFQRDSQRVLIVGLIRLYLARRKPQPRQCRCGGAHWASISLREATASSQEPDLIADGFLSVTCTLGPLETMSVCSKS